MNFHAKHEGEILLYPLFSSRINVLSPKLRCEISIQNYFNLMQLFNISTVKDKDKAKKRCLKKAFNATL